ncbi:hypothetical protein LRH25_24610 [Ideonella azotifigens]|uniref:Uncharacterized protein n=2 Tax=Ideonella azotifigens TaxID=513160 RepID=A0ABN1JIC1_9BURK|nr:hypothetical protein [Ideonella azotifigens]
MSGDGQKWLAARTGHLLGGLRAFNGFEPTVHVYPAVPGQQELKFLSRAYGTLYQDLKARDLLPIGFEFLTNSLEVKGLVPTNWRSYHPWGPKNIWPCEVQIEDWSQIGWVASKEGKAELWDLARRISHQLRVCAWRMYQLSDAYYAQLKARTAEQDISAGLRFEDGFTWLGYLAAQAYLVDACILRDYLAEFFVAFVCPAPDRPKVHIATMAGAKKHVLDKVKSSSPLFAELTSATSKGGWLFELGAYRDLCVHCVPLARSESRLFAVGIAVPIRGAAPLLGVSLPLPADPSAIAAERASPKRGDRLAEELKLMTSANRGEVSSADALLYCYSALDRLTQLATKLRQYSPVEPQMPTITDADLTGGIKVRYV